MLKDKQELDVASVPEQESFTHSFVTEAATPVRYACSLGSGWQCEETIEIASSDDEGLLEDTESEDE
jgi:hypothetical protein